MNFVEELIFMEDIAATLIGKWYQISFIIGSSGLVLSVLILTVYQIKLTTYKTEKAKHDLINRFEIDLLWYVSVLCVASLALVANSRIAITNNLSVFFVHIFLTVILASILIIISRYILNVYYPTILMNRLKYLRTKPRISPMTGKPMRLLSEFEEDFHLDTGMQSEEAIRSVDYDVWKDEETGYVHVEKYFGDLQFNQCPRCGYQTLRSVKEEVVKSPVGLEVGQVLIHYVCKFCNCRTKKIIQVRSAKEFV